MIPTWLRLGGHPPRPGHQGRTGGHVLGRHSAGRRSASTALPELQRDGWRDLPVWDVDNVGVPRPADHQGATPSPGRAIRQHQDPAFSPGLPTRQLPHSAQLDRNPHGPLAQGFANGASNTTDWVQNRTRISGGVRCACRQDYSDRFHISVSPPWPGQQRSTQPYLGPRRRRRALFEAWARYKLIWFAAPAGGGRRRYRGSASRRSRDRLQSRDRIGMT